MVHLPHSESHSRIDESSGERHLATRYGEESSQLAQTHHDGDAGGRDDEVAEEKAQRTARSERPGGTQEETSTDDTTDTAVREGRSVRWRGTLWGWGLTRSSEHDGSSAHDGARYQDQSHPSRRRFRRQVFSRIPRTSLLSFKTRGCSTKVQGGG